MSITRQNMNNRPKPGTVVLTAFSVGVAEEGKTGLAAITRVYVFSPLKLMAQRMVNKVSAMYVTWVSSGPSSRARLRLLAFILLGRFLFLVLLSTVITNI